MAARSREDIYTELDQSIDVEVFRDSILEYFSKIPDPRIYSRSTYRLEHIFFIILSAVLAGANSINQIHVFSQAKSKWIKT